MVKYQKMINSLNNTPSQASKFRKRYWVEVNDESCTTYVNNSQIRFKTSRRRSSLYDYSDAYILVNGTLAIIRAGAYDAAKLSDKKIKQYYFKIVNNSEIE